MTLDAGSATTPRPGLNGAEHYRVLLVEDDPGDALLVEESLADTGLPHSLRWRRDLATALADLAESPPDCVLLDLGLPDIVGVAAVEAIQAASPHAAVIVLTGLDEARSANAAVARGAQDYLVKGQVTTELLNRTLRYAVYRKRAERAAAELRENQIRARENARLERGLLPTPLVHSASVTVNSRYLPGREQALLGGDFLDVVQTSDGTVHAVIGDVSGHGPDEAALGVCLRITWRALILAGHRGTELLDLLEQVLVAERPRPEMFATCTTVAVAADTRSATLLLAGHHEPLLCTEGGAGEVSAGFGPALGITPGRCSWRPTTLELPAAGALMLYTDGLIEGRNGRGRERLGAAGLIDLIAGAPPSAVNGLLDHLIGTARTLDAGRHSDDLAILHLSWGRD